MDGKHINYTYYNTLTTKSSQSTFEFHGKSNTPNVVLTAGSRIKQYISRILSINEPSETKFDGELVIEHTLATNYGKKMILIFPLKTDVTIKPNIIDAMILASPGDSLEVNLNTVIMPQDSCKYNDANNTAIFITPILINTRLSKKNESIIEGFPDCKNGECCDAANLLTMQANFDALSLKVANMSSSYSSGNSVGGDGSTLNLSQEMMNKLLNENNLICDALPPGEDAKSYVAKLLDIDLDNNKKELDYTNPTAYSIAAITMACLTYFVVTTVYRKLFAWIRFNNENEVEPSLKTLHLYEGAFGFFLLFSCMIFLIDTPVRSIAAGGMFLCIWLIYSVVIGVSKKGIITDEVGGSYELDDLIKRVLRPMLFNMFIFYPCFPLIFGFEKIKHWFS